MPKLFIPPQRDTYKVAFGDGVIRTKLDGGLSKQRLDFVGIASLVDCQWILDPNEYYYLTTFFEHRLKFGALRFTLDMILNHPTPQEYVAYFNEPIELTRQSGLAYYVKSKLEAAPLVQNSALNELILNTYEGDENADLISLELADTQPYTNGLLPALTNAIDDVVAQGTAYLIENPAGVPSTFYAVNLPPGLSINSSNGTITGTVEGPVTNYDFTVIYGPNSGGIPIQLDGTWEVTA